MEITKLLEVNNRAKWRSWLEKNHNRSKEIWLVYYKKSSRKKRISYNDAVEEALCFGWIDSIMKPVDEERYAQRFTPRREKSALSELNKERIKRLIEAGLITKAGLDIIKHHVDGKSSNKKLKKFKIPSDILIVLKADPVVWKNFQKFPEHYKHIRIGWIDGSRRRSEEFNKRLDIF